MKYAENTTVNSERSRAEIETILGRYGASSFAYMWQGTAALILFEYNGKPLSRPPQSWCYIEEPSE